jgi:hypothetical protein
MFKTIIILCILAQQCVIVEHEEESNKLYQIEEECINAAERIAIQLDKSIENKFPPYIIRYTCEEVDVI